MTEVFKNLWLGNINDSLDLNFILKNNINCVINCTINQPFLQYKEIKYKYRIPIKDNLQNEEFYLLYLLLNKTIDIIIKHLLLNDRILIHCFAGKQRSVSFILAFYMKYYNITLKEAFKKLVKKYDILQKNYKLNFYKSLKFFEINYIKNK